MKYAFCNSDGQVVDASDLASRPLLGSLRCLLCGHTCVVVFATSRERHFRHLKDEDDTSCAQSTALHAIDLQRLDRMSGGQTPWHRAWSAAVRNECREVVLHGRPRDAALVDADLILEFQHSKMPPEEWAARCAPPMRDAWWIFDASDCQLWQLAQGWLLLKMPPFFCHNYEDHRSESTTCTLLFQDSKCRLFEAIGPCILLKRGLDTHIVRRVRLWRRDLPDVFKGHPAPWDRTADLGDVEEIPETCVVDRELLKRYWRVVNRWKFAVLRVAVPRFSWQTLVFAVRFLTRHVASTVLEVRREANRKARLALAWRRATARLLEKTARDAQKERDRQVHTVLRWHLMTEKLQQIEAKKLLAALADMRRRQEIQTRKRALLEAQANSLEKRVLNARCKWEKKLRTLESDPQITAEVAVFLSKSPFPVTPGISQQHLMDRDALFTGSPSEGRQWFARDEDELLCWGLELIRLNGKSEKPIAVPRHHLYMHVLSKLLKDRDRSQTFSPACARLKRH